MAMVDVILPAFNAAGYLAIAIESVLAQTFTDWRILLVDDGSTDTTAAIACSYQQRLGERLVIISQPNRGLPAARNAALRRATADLLALLDADDVWLPCRLAESVKAFAGRPAIGLSYGRATIIDEDGKPLRSFHGSRHPVEGRIAQAIYLREAELPCPTITFRRSCIEAVGLFDETLRATEDRELWLRSAFGFEVAFVPEVLALYRTSAHSMSKDLDRMFHAQRQFIRKHYGAPGCGFVARQRALARTSKERAEFLLARHLNGAALRSALRACLQWPLSTGNLRTAISIALRSTFMRSPSAAPG